MRNIYAFILISISLSSTTYGANLNEYCELAYPSNDFEGGGYNLAGSYRVADDFDIEAESIYDINKVSFNAFVVGTVTTIDIYFLSDDEGSPGDVFESYLNITPTSQTYEGTSAGGLDFYSIALDIPETISLSGGENGTKYWVAFGSSDSSTPVYMEISTEGTNATSYTSLYGSGWNVDPSGFQLVFKIMAECASSTDACEFEYPGTMEGGLSNLGDIYINAHDFDIQAETTFTLEKVVPSMLILADATITTLDIKIYTDNQGTPDVLIDSFPGVAPTSQIHTGTNTSGLKFYDVELPLSTPVELTGGETGTKYWVALGAADSSIYCYWEVTSDATTSEPAYTSYNWNTWNEDSSGYDGVFKLYGTCDLGGDPPLYYCDAIITGNVSPITYVSIAGIENNSPAESAPAHELFIDVEGNVMQTETYSITLEGNTNGNLTYFYTLFADWNQNGILDNEGEMYQIGSITNSTGTDGIQLTGEIVVPENALLGQTRMRIIHSYNSTPLDPCGPYQWGQAEDYTLNVEEFVDSYCEFVISETVEPITRVLLEDIDNESSSETSAVPHEFFLTVESEVEQEGIYEIKLEGNTNGNYENFFTVFIDWNQNGILDDPWEVYEIGSLTNSTGTDGQQLAGYIMVPEQALLGKTRMRIVKNRGEMPQNPCGTYTHGQAEDYKLNVISSSTPADIYCEIEITETIEPITRVVLAEIDNTSTAIYPALNHEYFLDIQGEVSLEETLEVALEGNTNGDNENFFTIFVDWNQNNILDDEGERYEIGSIINSTGTDGIQTIGSLAVPEEALLGHTRMRVIKSDGSFPVNPCGEYAKGQAEDYSFLVKYPGDICEQIFESNNLENGLGDISDNIVTGLTIANDFDVLSNTNFFVTHLTPNIIGEISTIDVEFYEDNAGEPGEVIFSFNDLPVSQTFIGENFDLNFYETEISFPQAVELSGGTNGSKFWVGLKGAEPANNIIYWETKTTVSSELSYIYSQTPSGEWVWSPNENGYDGVFKITGHCQEVLATSDIDLYDLTFYPNPVRDYLTIETKGAIKSISAFNLSGQSVLKKKKTVNKKINLGHWPSGLYLFKVTFENGGTKVLKITKE